MRGLNARSSAPRLWRSKRISRARARIAFNRIPVTLTIGSTYDGVRNRLLPARFHRSSASVQRPDPPEMQVGHGLKATAQQQIRSLRIFTDAMNIFATMPRNDLLSQREDDEAYCLAEPGKQYAVFFPNGRSVDLDLSALPGDLRAGWFDIGKGTWAREVAIPGGAHVFLKAPGPGQWAVLILAPNQRASATAFQESFE